jgi:hypothetical protein
MPLQPAREAPASRFPNLPFRERAVNLKFKPQLKLLTMGTGISPFNDLTRAHSILESCQTEPQLDTALNFFELVLQKWENLLSIDSVQAFRKEFHSEFFQKKQLLRVE